MHCAKCFFYESEVVSDDVCNRCGRAYMPEANVYLGILMLVTGGMAYTLRHLLTGHLDPFVRPTLDLAAWATWPVSLVDCPAYGLVMGGWVAMLAAAPVLTSILYGKRGGLLLIIVIALLGPDIVMAGATGVGVWVAGNRRWQLGSKFATALVGLAPSVAYWFIATARGDVEALAPALRPETYVVPISATVFAVTVCGLVVASGWGDRWHIRWPGSLLTVLAAGPVLALLAFVGVDTVRFGLELEPPPVPTLKPAAALSETARLAEFLKRHPKSIHADEVRARLALRLEEREGEAAGKTPPPPPPKTPAPRSQDLWQELIKESPDSPWRADALLHLGDTTAREGLFDAAEQSLRAGLARTATIGPSAEDPLAKFSAVWDYFTIGRDLAARETAEHMATVRRDLQMHLALLVDNRKGAQDNSRSLALYFVAVRYKGSNRFRERLLAVQEADPSGALADNVALELAMFEPDDAKRIERLREVVALFPGTDGAMLANLAAARALTARAASDPGALREARQHLVAIQADLARRVAARRDDPYAAALTDSVEKELVYVQAQLRTPE